MAVKTQGTQLYALVPSEADPAIMEVLEIKQISNFNGGGNPADQIVLEHLDKTTREYLKGMRTPGQATFNVDADVREASHLRLYEMASSDAESFDNVKFAAGWSDGYGVAPTVATGGDDFELPATRTWFVFEGNVSDFPFDFQSNTVVKTAVTIQRSGPAEWVKKST